MKNFTLILVFLMTLSFHSAAAIEANGSGIERITSYSSFGQGDVSFWLVDNEGKTCFGYWLDPTKSGFDANYSLLLSAYHANAKVVVRGITNESVKWSGSSTYHHCLVDSIELKR